jgi:hypothetical protein
MRNIFISYSRENEAIVKTLADDIVGLGDTVWFDQKLSGGQVWWDEILTKICDCDVFLFVLDPASMDSTACKREFGYAKALKKPILPVLISDEFSTILLPSELSELSKIQFVDYRKQNSTAGMRLAKALENIPSSEHLPDPLPPPPEMPFSYLEGLKTQIETCSSLNSSEQRDLVHELQRAFYDPVSAKDARHLLQKLRKRSDLFASNATDIDDILKRVSTEALPSTPSANTVASSLWIFYWAIISMFVFWGVGQLKPVYDIVIMFAQPIKFSIIVAGFGYVMYGWIPILSSNLSKNSKDVFIKTIFFTFLIIAQYGLTIWFIDLGIELRS